MQSTITTTVEASALRARDSTDSSRRSQTDSSTPHGSQLTTCFLTLRPPLVCRNPAAYDINAPEARTDEGESQAREVQADALNKPTAAAPEQAEAIPRSTSSTARIKAAGDDEAAAGAEASTGTDEVVYEEAATDMEATSQAMQGNQLPLYVRVKRRRDEPPPPFLCVLRPQKRQQMPDGAPSGVSVLERALIFKHVDAAPPPVAAPFFSEGQPPSQESDELQQPQTSKEHATVERTQKDLTGETVHAGDQGSTGDAEKLAATEERTTFWNAFNTPLRQDVFGSFAGTGTIAPARLEYRDVVEEAVKSLRRFRVDNQQQGGRLRSHSNAQQANVLLHAGNAIQVLDVCPDGCHAATDLSEAQAASHEFEYDLYAIECDSGENYPWERPGRLDTHKQRLLELLQQDTSAVALVEVEDVDEETGIVTRGKGSMQVFLEEFGDIDDSDSDEDGEIDYPSGESSDDRERCRPRHRWNSALSGSGSGGSSQSEEDEDFDDDDF